MADYDRELIAEMLEAAVLGVGGYTSYAMAEQAELLREADNREHRARTVSKPDSATHDGGEVETRFIDGMGWVVACSDASRFVDGLREKVGSREVIAREFERDGFTSMAASIRRGDPIPLVDEDRLIRTIDAALSTTPIADASKPEDYDCPHSALDGCDCYSQSSKPGQPDIAGFKNFHRSLCARFGYTHDESFWWRDLVSLEEHIAALSSQASKPGHVDVEQKARELLVYFGLDDIRSGSRAVGHSGPENDEWEDYIEVPIKILATLAAALSSPRADVVTRPTDHQIRAWMERHDLGSMNITDAWAAVDDARSLEYSATAPDANDATTYTTGHCTYRKSPLGCPFHNLQCGWPNCDRKPTTAPDESGKGGREKAGLDIPEKQFPEDGEDYDSAYNSGFNECRELWLIALGKIE